MATCRAIVNGALRRLVVVSEGQPTAQAYDALVGLENLQSLYLDNLAAGLFGRLEDVLIEDDYEAGENERIYNSDGVNHTVTLPTTITDECTGEERPPKNRSVVYVADAEPQAFIYSHQVGGWVEMTGLTLDSTAPLSDQGSDGLEAWLATRLADVYGAQLSPVTIGSAARFRAAQAMKFDVARTTTPLEFF